MQSNPGLHVGIIMDGNGRWATARGLPREAGHAAGVAALRRIVAAAPEHGISTLTVYAFSSDNWRRPAPEVSALMGLFQHFLRNEIRRMVAAGVRLTAIGRRDRLPAGLTPLLEHAETASKSGSALHLRLAIDYSGRDAIVRAIADAPWPPTRQHLSQRLSSDVDLVIRTSGEQRLSDFLVWEAAYAELYFTDRLWPDFDADDLAEAMHAFHRRNRRFGGLPTTTANLEPLTVC